jgi:phage baseplate assembly protein V
MIREQLYRLLSPIRRQISIIIGRALLEALDDSKGLQLLKVSLLKDEIKDKVERVIDYGLISVPPPGSEALVACIGGSKDQMVVIAVDNSKSRKKGCASGDTGLYRDGGDYILLSSDSIKIHSSKKIVLDCTDVVIGGTTGGATSGVVTGECICAFTGAPHPDTSSKVKVVK